MASALAKVLGAGANDVLLEAWAVEEAPETDLDQQLPQAWTPHHVKCNISPP